MPAIGDALLENSTSPQWLVLCGWPRSKAQPSSAVCDTPATLCQLSKQRHGTFNPYSRMYCSFTQSPAECLPSVMHYSIAPLPCVHRSSADGWAPSHSYQLSSATHQPATLCQLSKQRHGTTTPYSRMYSSFSPLPDQCLPSVMQHSKALLPCVRRSSADGWAPSHSFQLSSATHQPATLCQLSKQKARYNHSIQPYVGRGSLVRVALAGAIQQLSTVASVNYLLHACHW